MGSQRVGHDWATFTSLWRWAWGNSGKEHFRERNSKCKSPKLKGCYKHKEHEESKGRREKQCSNKLTLQKEKKKKAVIFSVCQFLIPWLSSSYHHDVGECDLWMRCPQLVLMSLFLSPQNHRLIVLNRFIEMCSTKLVIREMKIRTTMKDRLTPFSVAIIKKWRLADVDEYVEKKALLRQWHPTPVLMPGKSHGWRSLVGCSPWGR